MTKRTFSLLAVTIFVILLSLPLAGLAARSDSSSSNSTSRIVALSSSDEQFSFTFAPGEMSLQNGRIAVDGLTSLLRAPGAPELPYYQTLIALPPGAIATAELVINGSEQVEQVGYLKPAPQQNDLDMDLSNLAEVDIDIDALALEDKADAAIYELDAYYPGERLTLSEPAYLRDLRVVSLKLFPLSYNPATGSAALITEMTVTVHFQGSNMAIDSPLASRDDGYLQGFAGSILNFEQAGQWRHTPVPAGGASNFPTGIDTYRIAVTADGIHEISYADLQAAGMDVDNIDPGTLEMMYRGNPVAYQFVGNGNNVFESGEAVRFYGEIFDSSRYEELYEDTNFYWIWAGGTPTLAGSSSSDSGQPAATSFRDTAILEAQNWYYTSQTNQWDEFPNDPDAFYYDYVIWSVENFSKAYPINLPDPDTSGDNVSIKVEFFSLGQVLLGLVEQDHAATVTLNNDPNVGMSPTPWKGRRSENTFAFIPASALLDGTNNVNVVFATNIDDGVNSTTDRLLINDITVEYNRFFVAVDDQLIFNHAGQHAFTISDLATNVPADLNIWEITNPLQPVRLDSTSASITGSGPYSVSFGDSTSGDIAYIVATEAAIIDVAPADLTEYNGPDLDPAGGADWIAISHSSMLTAANNLATHRSNALYGGMATQVVDVQDIYNQYGYGFALPTAIQDYLSHAMNDWPIAPGYVVLFGDANINPNGHPTLNGTSWWIADEPNFVVTDFKFVDRFLGLVPSDHMYSTLIGTDLIPDIAVGRLAAQSNAEAQAMVDKIIFYEQNGQSAAGLDGHEEVLFVSDNADEGGDFCQQNILSASYIPGSFTTHPLCLDNMTVDALRQSMKDLINSPNGISLLNYRGHGAVNAWAGNSPSNAILHVNSPSFWLNPGNPPVVFSLDCLDGNFAQPGFPSLGETILGYEMKGTAGHWSSTGLGFWFEHELLAIEVYDGLFGQGMVRFGDAINFSKTQYWQASQTFGYDVSELYSFVLQGDPAMHLFRSEVSLDKQVNATSFQVGDPVTLTLTIENNALYPAHVVITDTMPAGVTYLGYSATTTATLLGPEPSFALSWGGNITDTVHGGIPAGAQATLEVYGVASRAGEYDHTAQLQVTGFDLNLANNQATVSYDIMQKILLPIIVRR